MKIGRRIVDQYDGDVRLVIKITMDGRDPCQLIGVEDVLRIGASSRIQSDEAAFPDGRTRDHDFAGLGVVIIEDREWSEASVHEAA